MKVIFLDIDGVLVHHGFNPIPGKLMDHMDPACVEQLNKAIVATQAKVVIHSTWVYVDKPEHIIQRLIEAGFDITNLHQQWICKSDRGKSIAISNWLKEHIDVKRYVVIDDERIGQHPQVHIYAGMFKNGLNRSDYSYSLAIVKELSW